MPYLVYLHGFLSSPQSHKATATQNWLKAQRPDIAYLCPSLSSYPNEALKQIRGCLESCEEKPYLIGSSLGGFWASYFIERGLAEKAVLVNPAVSPHLRFTDRIGVPQKSYYSNDIYTLQIADLETLGACEPDAINDLSRYWLMLQTGDEVLDYRMATKRYSGAKLLLEEGGDHSFVGYEHHISDILNFFGI